MSGSTETKNPEKTESFKETLEILHDRELMESIKRSEEDVKTGRVCVIKGKTDVSKLFGV